MYVLQLEGMPKGECQHSTKVEASTEAERLARKFKKSVKIYDVNLKKPIGGIKYSNRTRSSHRGWSIGDVVKYKSGTVEYELISEVLIKHLKNGTMYGVSCLSNLEFVREGSSESQKEGTSQCKDILNSVLHNATKEKAMEINESIRKVFTGEAFELVEAMQDAFGEEISETFTGEINLKANKKKYIAELERRDEEAEAKKLEAEETKK